MNTYETLVYLATEPYEKKAELEMELLSSDTVLKALNKEFSNSQFVIDSRQACETMVYNN